MLTDHRCTKYTDCSSCSFYQRDIFKYRLYPKGYVIPQTRCMQNMVFFLVKGEIWLNSEEHPDTTFRGGQFVLQPIGSKVECKVLDYTECIIYLFERPQNICDNRFNKGISIVENERQQPIVMTMVPPIQLFIEGMKLYLNDVGILSGILYGSVRHLRASSGYAIAELRQNATTEPCNRGITDLQTIRRT